jgi:hypothetical protein
MKKLLLILLILTMTQTTNAAVTSSTDSNGTQYYYYSSYPMPKATWKTKIAIKSLSSWQWIVAVPFYYYGNNINNDIIKLRTYLTSKGISYRDGICITFPYTTPCLR